MTVFEAPGAGQWDLDRSHYGGGLTPISAELMCAGPTNAYRLLFEKFGVPADTVDARVVNGFYYTRLRPLIGADRRVSKPPPVWAIKLAGRLHPELRRRAKAAQVVMDNPPWDTVVEEWQTTIKPRLIATNLEFQSVDLAALSSDQLADHLEKLVGHVRFTFEEHHRLHGYDLGPIGQLVVAGADWGIETEETLSALVGASPSTTEPRAQTAAIRAEVERAGGSLDTLDTIRAASPEATAMLDAYIARHGSLLYSSYDLDSPTLIERPEVLAASIRCSQPPVDVAEGAANVAAKLRARVPPDDQSTFDEYLSDARSAMNMRDDNGPITVEWPAGLLRLSMIEAGERLATSGRIQRAEHVFELTCDELPALARSGTGPTASELADRATERSAQKLLDPPIMLGTEEPPPPLEALPPASATLIKIVSAVTEELITAAEPAAPGATELHGTGIGSARYVGVARTATTAEEAISALADGEILVTRGTSPAYNLVLSIAGGLVTETGGAMCHAAVLSRELGLPAVIGAAGCLDLISSGDRLEIDPLDGTVRILAG